MREEGRTKGTLTHKKKKEKTIEERGNLQLGGVIGEVRENRSRCGKEKKKILRKRLFAERRGLVGGKNDEGFDLGRKLWERRKQ